MQQSYKLPEMPIFCAARLGDLAALQQLLDEGANINDRTDIAADHGLYLQQLTPLMVAARSADGASVDTLRWLIDHGADLYTHSAGGATAAWYAAGDGRALVEEQYTSRPEHVDRLRFLLDAGLDPNETVGYGQSLLTEACSVGDPARVALLLKRNVNLTPVLDKGTYQKLAYLRRDGENQWADRPHSFQIPLFCAAEAGSAACIQLLLAAGADVHARDDGGATALMYAANAETISVLLAAGSDVAATDAMDRDAFQHLIERETSNEERENTLRQAIAVLAATRVDINASLYHKGWTRLYCAAFAQNPQAVQRLLDLGADPQMGQPPLNAVCFHYSNEFREEMARIIDLLVSAGCDVNERDPSGDTLLHCAALDDAHAPGEAYFNNSSDGANVTAVYCLLKHGADPDPVGQRGWTPLMVAAHNTSVPIVRALLQAGADPMRQNADGHTAVEIAHHAYQRYKQLTDQSKLEPKDDEVDQFSFHDEEWAEESTQAAKACWDLLQHFAGHQRSSVS